MTTLLIDDLRNFRVRPEGGVSIARTSQQALDFLKADPSQHYDTIWFDHDLGLTKFGVVDTTMVVVDYMCEQAFNGEPIDVDMVYVHSSNPVGVKQIMLSLERFGYPVKSVLAPTVFVV